MKDRDIYTNISKSFLEYLDSQKKKINEKHGTNMGRGDCSNLLLKGVLLPNEIDLSKLIRPIEIKKKNQKNKIRLKL